MNGFLVLQLSVEQCGIFLAMTKSVVGRQGQASQEQIDLLSAIIASTANALLEKLDEPVRYEMPAHLPTVPARCFVGTGLLATTMPGFGWYGQGANN
jgi:hypothetical protein